ncbi:hypothetical protein SERLA73DRAFT_178381 [Serpula lacrymans var. lacrymans S7.3]|uniref:Uncharacterized protein n=2 Tax=Serpula lacrymans var. lacrymans TaxID=341189 RepID=F8PRC5_SERL3|nr:uncharacterized protein SERLADRAFT_462794 [Serpula lacrymans var. lacrymans S7.9]EGO00548.1 hypothetical protein SERLA73DRAFT_178381 [Serpula lacrymans var. lacrymans S7.3]EGO26105.1 hypothetical protein SERLADRAFT_462794 [Serpula lacrymans var. lacrymans S7.9]
MGDMTLLACFGLFANPTTVWREYSSMHIDQGLRYYNPLKGITSTVEVGQVHQFLVALSKGYTKSGIVVRLKTLPKRQWLPTSFSWEWFIVRPLLLIVMIYVAGVTLDYVAIGALCSLLVGQAIAVVTSIADGPLTRTEEQTEEQSNVFFMANGVTIIVKAPGQLFIEATSFKVPGKANSPESLRLVSMMFFMGGVLLVGMSGMLFRISYLAGHIIQAGILVLARRRSLRQQTVNRVEWIVETDKVQGSLNCRRDSYVWAVREVRRQPWDDMEWLRIWNLATGETFSYVEQALASSISSNDEDRSIEDGVVTIPQAHNT